VNKLFLLLIFAALLSACNRVKETAKETINKTGETIVQGTSEFVEGVKNGVNETFGCKLELGPLLQRSTMASGKFNISSDSTGKDNLLTVYMIFNNGFNGTIRATVYDPSGAEYGRAKTKVEAASGDAQYVEFRFDKRTDIESRSRIVLESAE
jgi:hypothetical protein